MNRIRYLIPLVLVLLFLQFSAAEPIKKIDAANQKYLVFGKTNKHVKQLQEFLNENGFYDCEDGPGSPGLETESFGLCTEASIKVFQEYYNLPITGLIDNLTASKINYAIDDYSKEFSDEYKGNGAEFMSRDILLKQDGTIDLDLNKSNNTFEEMVEEVEEYDILQINKNEDVTNTSEDDFFKNFFETVSKKKDGKNVIEIQNEGTVFYKSIISTIWNSIFKN